MQIWKSAHIFFFIWKNYVEGFTLKHLFLFEIYARKICQKFPYKHLETIEFVKNYATLNEIYKLHRQITQEFVGLRMGNFQGIAFKWTQTYRVIFKFALAYV